jgi:hypothetical protein
VIFDPAKIDETALDEYLVKSSAIARGTRGKQEQQEHALAVLHASEYDVDRALRAQAPSRGGPSGPIGPNGTNGPSGPNGPNGPIGPIGPIAKVLSRRREARGGARPRTAAEWRAMQARLNARRDAHDEPVAPGDVALLRSHVRLPYAGRVERVRGDHVKVRWFYRQGDLHGKVDAAPNELFLSSHTDTNHVSAIVGNLGTFRALSNATGAAQSAHGAAGAPFCRRAVCYPASAAQVLVCIDRGEPRA